MTSTLIKIGAKKYRAEDIEAPSDRTFREAWKIDQATGVVEVDMAKARKIMQNHIRMLRAPLLAELDAEFMKALETGADTASIAMRKQKLRDATKHPDLLNATTPEALKKAAEKCL